MIYAKGQSGSRIPAEPGAAGQCPTCGESLIPKCGSVNVWHWAHRSGDCDPWFEPETEWHIGWKQRFPGSAVEVPIGPHRADVVTGKRIVELQHSPIDSREAIQREQFYGLKLVWLFDASAYEENLDFRQKDDIFTFRWKWPRKMQWDLRRSLYWDLGRGLRWEGPQETRYHLVQSPITGESRYEPRYHTPWLTVDKPIFKVEKIHHNVPCGGWGRALSVDEFINEVS